MEVTSCVVDLVVTFSVVAPVVVVAVVLGFLVDGTMAELVEVVGAAVVSSSNSSRTIHTSELVLGNVQEQVLAVL